MTGRHGPDDDLSADGCHTKAPVKGDKAGRSPVDRGKQGLKRSTLVEARGVPLSIASDGANRHDSKLLEPTIAVAERQWMNGDGKIRRCFEGDGQVVDFYLYLPAAFVTVRALIREARARYRWDTRPTTGRLK